MNKSTLNFLFIVFMFNLSLIGQENCKQVFGSSYSECLEGVNLNLISNICQESGLELHMTEEFIMPIPLCDGGNSVLNNPSYYSFIADGSAPFGIIVSPISGSCSNNQGIQGALVGFGDCNSETPYSIPCQTDCTMSPFLLETKFIPTQGQIIVLVLDGCSGDLCDVNFEIVSGWSDTLIIPSDEELNESVIIAESDVNCSNYILTLDPPFDGICDYRWTFPDGSVQNISASQINVDVSNFPDGTICVQGYSEGCYPGELFPSENTICYSYTAKDYLEIEVGSESTTCGKNDGVAFVEVSGEGPFQYEWSNGAADSTIVNVDAGMYFVTVTDGFGCEQVDSVEVIASDEISTELEVVNPDCSGSFGIITIDALGGGGDYDYTWSPISNSENFADSLSVGQYFITITDATDPSCFQIISVDLLLNDNLEMVIEEILPSLALENTGSILIEINENNDYYYELIFPGGSIESDTISGNTIEFSGLGVGIYQLIVVGIESGCSDTLDFEIELISSIFESKINKINQLHVFPNPVTNILHFEDDVVGSYYQMYSLEGKMISRGILEENHIDLTDLLIGSYILIIENARGVKKMAKVVKVE